MNFLNPSGIQFEQFDLLELLVRMSVALLLSASAGLISFWSVRSRKITEPLLFGGVTLSLIITMILLVLSANIFYALGLFAALSIIRFRTPVKDVRDTVHLFLCIGIGIACGAGALKIALFCTFFILSVQQVYQQFSTQKRNLLIVKIISLGNEKINLIENFLKSQSRDCEIIKASQTSSQSTEHCFHLSIKQSTDIKAILSGITHIDPSTQVEIFPCRNEDL